MNHPAEVPVPEEIPNEPPNTRRTPAVLLATGMGVGLVMPAPGTFGALMGVPLAAGLERLPDLWQWLTVAALLAVGVPLCTRAARDLGGRKDPGAIIWDEIATVPLVFLLVPASSIYLCLIGFALHRLFDITKPWPCRRLERLPEGLGIMIDDCVAAIYAAAIFWVIYSMKWWPA